MAPGSAGAPCTVAPGEWAYTQGVRRDPDRHPAEDFLLLLDACGLPPAPICNQFILPDRVADEARRLFLARGLEPAKPTLFIQPFTSSASQELAPGPVSRGRLSIWQRRGLQVLFSGGPTEQTALEPAREAGFPVSAGASLLVTAGLMKLSTLILGGDTGVLHLAVAMDQRVIMIMNSIGPGSSHPFQHADWTVTPASGQSVAAITTDAVNGACGRAFAALGVQGAR